MNSYNTSHSLLRNMVKDAVFKLKTPVVTERAIFLVVRRILHSHELETVACLFAVYSKLLWLFLLCFAFWKGPSGIKEECLMRMINACPKTDWQLSVTSICTLNILQLECLRHNMIPSFLNDC